MANIKNDVTNRYYSGQGVVLIGTRDAVNGKPQALFAMGNVSDLKISIATSVIDHKGSQDGQRAIDKRLQTETKVTLSISVQNFIAKNLASALRGTTVNKAAGTATAEVVSGWIGGVTGLANVNTGTMTITRTIDSAVMSEYVDDNTPWDFKQNTDAGSFKLNDASAQPTLAVANSLITVTAVTGSGTSPTITGTHSLQVGDLVAFPLDFVTGANAAALNGRFLQVATITTTTAFTVTQIGTGNVVATTIVLSNGKAYGQQRTTANAINVTAVAVSVSAGLPTTLTAVNNCAPGDTVFLAGFTGANASVLNLNGAVAAGLAKPGFFVVTATATTLTIARDTSGMTITVGTTASMLVEAGQGLVSNPMTVSYSYTAQVYIDSLNTAPQELYMRFEGLNTADTTITNGIATQSPVVVEVWKFATDPLKELALISDAFGDFVLEGALLSDPLKVTGSKFFAVKKLN